jgi:hypothetical protein
MYLYQNANSNNRYSISENQFSKLKGYDFIIVNRPLGFADTIADLTYSKKVYREVCDKCFLGDFYDDCEKIENVRFKNKNISITADSLLVNRN